MSVVVSSPEHGGIVAWISHEVLPHEAAVRRWLARSLDPDAVEDVIQESYCRIAALDHVHHIRSGRAYLFTTARNLLLQQVRRQRVVRIEAVAEIDALGIGEDAPSPERVVAGRSELDRVVRLIAALPARCREVMELRKVHNVPQRVVAARLGISEHVVENEVAKGLKAIARALADGEMAAERKLGSIGDEQRARAGKVDR